MDDFKKYMQQHAGEMDFDEPGEAVWKNIAAKTSKPKQGGKVLMFVRFAAAACFILLIGFAGFLINRKPARDVAKNNTQHSTEISTPAQRIIKSPELIRQPEQPLAKQVFEKPSTKVLPANKAVTIKSKRPTSYNQQQNAPMPQNIQNSFSQLVSIQLNKVRSLPLYAEGPEYYSEFKKQFQQLEEDEKELKKRIHTEGLVNENLDNLINVYQQKLNLLKLLQNEINKTNSRYRQNNNTDSTTQINYINI